MSTSFGRDTSCTNSMRTGRFASGLRLVAEAAYRRLITPRGMLRGGDEEANYGFNLAELIGSTTSAADAAALPGRIAAELLKDERLESVDAVVTPMKSGPVTTFQIAVSARTAEGPFVLTINASSVTVELIGIKEAA